MFYFLKVTVPVSGMITIPAASLAGAQIVQTGANTSTTSSGQGTVTVTLPVAGNVVNSGGMVMVRRLVVHFTFLCISFFVNFLNLRAGGLAQAVAYLLHKCEALGSSSSTTKKIFLELSRCRVFWFFFFFGSMGV
jgi:hypothetical protein